MNHLKDQEQSRQMISRHPVMGQSVRPDSIRKRDLRFLTQICQLILILIWTWSQSSRVFESYEAFWRFLWSSWRPGKKDEVWGSLHFPLEAPEGLQIFRFKFNEIFDKIDFWLLMKSFQRAIKSSTDLSTLMTLGKL